MKANTVLTDLPDRLDWFFGGFPYGLEPLTLPNSAEANVQPGGSMWGDRSPRDYEACLRILQVEKFSDVTQRVEGGEAAKELFWFRWMTGHQVSFIIWRLMAQTLHDLEGERLPQAAAVEALSHYVRGYCAMLLYTGSCPKNIYDGLIRPSMHLQHRGFSGSWAPDFRPVRDVFRGRQRAGLAGQNLEKLVREIKLCQAVHNGVAAKLVPDGQSLLQRSSAARSTPGVHRPNLHLLGVIYDNYFMTLRAPLSLPDIVAQLLRRLVAVSQDVTVNGLYPVTVEGAEDRPQELHSPEILDFESGFSLTNFRVASAATGIISREVDKESQTELNRVVGG